MFDLMVINQQTYGQIVVFSVDSPTQRRDFMGHGAIRSHGTLKESVFLRGMKRDLNAASMLYMYTFFPGFHIYIYTYMYIYIYICTLHYIYTHSIYVSL